MQPHRYTRLHALMEEFQSAFNDADVVFVAPVYAAGEEPIEGADSDALVEGLRAHGHRMVKAVDRSRGPRAQSLRDIAAEGDTIICMGAGDITKWAAGLADGIAKRGRANERRRRIGAAGSRRHDRAGRKPRQTSSGFEPAARRNGWFEPKDEADLAQVPWRAGREHAGHSDRRRVEPDRPRRRSEGSRRSIPEEFRQGNC
jgi:hypothetical protein